MKLPGDVDDFVGVRRVESASESQVLVFGPDEVGFGRVDGVLGHWLPTLKFVVQNQRMLPNMIRTCGRGRKG